MSCQHEHFAAQVDVYRLTTEEGGPVTGYLTDVTVRCAQCGAQFEFLGLEPGCDTQGARVSLDGQTASLAITPPGARPNPLQRMAYNVRRFSS